MQLDTLNDLDAFLMSDRAPGNSMKLSDLDGFLTALTITPATVTQADYLSAIWNDEEPDFDDDDEKQWVIETIQVRYDEIAETVRNDPYQLTPIFWVGSGGQQVVDDWAAGFLDAVRLYADAWQPVFESDDAFLSLLALIISGEDDEALQKMKITPEEQRETLNHLPQLLPACILHLRDFMAGHGGMIGDDNAAPTTH